MRINIVLLKYMKVLLKNTFSAIFTVLFCFFIADFRNYNPILTLSNNKRWLEKISTKFRRPLKQCNVLHSKASQLLCSINAISSPSYVFKLENPIALHCLISPLKNWDVWVFFYGANNPIEIHSCNSFYEL